MPNVAILSFFTPLAPKRRQPWTAGRQRGRRRQGVEPGRASHERSNERAAALRFAPLRRPARGAGFEARHHQTHLGSAEEFGEHAASIKTDRYKNGEPRTMLQLERRISATISGWDCPLTFIYPGFEQVAQVGIEKNDAKPKPEAAVFGVAPASA